MIARLWTLDVMLSLIRVALAIWIIVLVVRLRRLLFQQRDNQLQDRSTTEDNRDPQDNSRNSQHVILDSKILGRLFIRFPREHGEKGGKAIHCHRVRHAFLSGCVAYGGLSNISKRCRDFLAHVLQGKIKVSLTFPLKFARHSPGLSGNHTDPVFREVALSDVIGHSDAKTGTGNEASEVKPIGPNTLTFHMTYIV